MEYSLGELLGRGSYGRVYKGEKNGKSYAIKIFYHPDYYGIACPQEISILLTYPSPYLVKAYECLKRDNTYWLVMELAEGTLQEKISCLSQDKKLEYVNSLMGATAHLHAQGIMHYDIRPTNCLICDGKLKLADLSLSFSRFSPIPVRPAWEICPPELMWEKNFADYTKVDIWGLGVTLLYLLTGRYLLGCGNKEEMRQNMSNYLLSPKKYLAEFNFEKAYLPIISRMLSPNPKDRRICIVKATIRNALPLYPLEKSKNVNRGRNYLSDYFCNYKTNVHLAQSAFFCYYHVCAKNAKLNNKPNLLAFVCIYLFNKIYQLEIEEIPPEFCIDELAELEWKVLQLINFNLYFETPARKMGEKEARQYLFTLRDYGKVCKNSFSDLKE